MTVTVPTAFGLVVAAGLAAPAAPTFSGNASVTAAVEAKLDPGMTRIRRITPSPRFRPARSGMPDTITIARLRYGGGGDWYSDPSSLPNLLEAISIRTELPVAANEATVHPLDPSLPDHPYLYMTGHGDVRFSPPERAALRAHLEAGGFLHADDNYGLDETFREEMALIFPDAELTPIPADHAVFHSFYEMPDGLPKIHEHDGEPPEALGIFLKGRLVVFYSHESDLGDGWEDELVHGDPPEVREEALRMGINLFVYALGQTVR